MFLQAAWPKLSEVAASGRSDARVAAAGRLRDPKSDLDDHQTTVTLFECDGFALKAVGIDESDLNAVACAPDVGHGQRAVDSIGSLALAKVRCWGIAPDEFN